MRGDCLSVDFHGIIGRRAFSADNQFKLWGLHGHLYASENYMISCNDQYIVVSLSHKSSSNELKFNTKKSNLKL